MSLQALAAKALAILVLLAGCFGAGWHFCNKYHQAAQAQEALERSETSRESERLAARAKAKVTDDLNAAQRARARDADDASRLLRELSDRYRSQRADLAACRDAGAPAVAVLRDEDRDDLVAAAREADQVVERLRAWQAWQAWQRSATVKACTP